MQRVGQKDLKPLKRVAKSPTSALGVRFRVLFFQNGLDLHQLRPYLHPASFSEGGDCSKNMGEPSLAGKELTKRAW